VVAAVGLNTGSSVTVVYSRDRFDELSAYFADWTDNDAADWTRGSISVDQGGATIRAENWPPDDERGINVTDCFGPDGADALCVILLDF
jgi:hypothetical protein